MTTAVLPARTALPDALRRPLLALAIPAAVIVAVLAVRVAGAGSASALDRWILDASGGAIPYPSAQRVTAKGLDFAGEPAGAGLLVAALVVLCLVLGHRRTALLAVLGPGLSVAVTTLLKPVVGRTINGPHLSFPSGHTAIVTAMVLVFAFVLADRLRLRPPAATAVVLYAAVTAGAAEAWAQFGMVVHYPTDTLGGFCVALVVVPMTAWLLDRVRRRAGTPA
ncbi:phosphatase PAP2 family protein [Amycolatopsis thermoflava]|uniref:Undecaprenyl-diphosphatase n=1 Tax=Amycolatopsis thermoflava TaxID=84480 RepID=A0A3N2GWB3_9PSEU|nr:phosphatase PAP2 family protein [Amycolatopsis thermoflava]ROS40540.1 undecaprenyl-diphosphatase [Amycolatopsis thermoflava]